MGARRGAHVHEAAARGFARSADAYERARPEYPPEAVAWLAGRLGLGPGRRVVDLAAGTGKLTRPLAATGADVVAVEPLAEMRARIGPVAEALEGTAEAMPLPAGDADAVTVGQAFHWFDGPAALAEVHRVLRPGGALALLWNRRTLEDPVQAAIEEIIAPYRGETPAHRSGAWRAALDSTTLFGPLEERAFAHAHPAAADADALADRVGSISYIAALDDTTRAGVLAAVRALADGGPVPLPYVCEVFVCDRRP
jgi:SAM-dependent methyltransferase